MKKLITLLFLTLFTLSACSSVPSISYDLSPEKEAEYEELLAESLEKLSEDGITEGDYNEALKNVAVSYQRLGKTQKAIDYYEKLLERHETNYTALNNMTAIYQELEYWEEATEYGAELFVYYGSDETIADKVIRIHVEAGEYEEAVRLLEVFSMNYLNDENQLFISDTFEYINRVASKNASLEESESEEE